MQSSCASNLSSLLTRRAGHLPELLDEDARPALLDVVVYDGFGNLVSPPDLPARFAFAALEQSPGEGMEAAKARLYDPTPGRWAEADPIGFAAADANLYRYVSDQPGILINEDGTIRDA